MRAMLVVLLATLVACGPSRRDDGDTSGSSVPPGDQTFTPTSPAQTTSSDTTSVSCSSGDDCAYWYCRCADRMVVNGSFCNQGRCSSASAICPSACATFHHGDWTGEAGGGPVSPSSGGTTGPTCSSGSECASFSCECADGASVDASNCSNGHCSGEAATCAIACEDHGGQP